MGNTLAALRNSAFGRFVKKLGDDRVTNLAVLLAWGTLNTLFPLLLGVSALVGLVLQDQERLDAVVGSIVTLFPTDVAEPLQKVLQDTRQSASVLGVIGVGLLVWNGSGFFANMESVFNQAYHVPDRSFLLQRLVALGMLVVASLLLLLSTVASNLATLLSTASGALFALLGTQPPGAVAPILGWVISSASAAITFLLIYRVLPNKRMGIRQAAPGALLVSMLFLLMLQVFPLYLTFFGKSFQTYAVFGLFLLLMFWSYVLGLVLVLGAELNAFLEEPALAEQSSATQPTCLAPLENEARSA